MRQDVRKLEYIDALRGYAVAAVLILHCSQALPPASDWLGWLMSLGEHGVQLFYVVSAITLCMSWQYRSPEETTPLRNFFLRRFFRIAPLFYVAIVYYTIALGLGPSQWAPSGAEWYYPILTALFLHGFHPETINTVVPGGWSVAVEMTFYLMLPVLATRLQHQSHRIVFLIVSVIVARLGQATWIEFFSGYYAPEHQYVAHGTSYYSFPTQLPVFAIGILVYGVISDRVSLGKYVTAGNGVFVAIVALGLLFAPAMLKKAASHYLVASFLFALVAANLAYRHNPVICNAAVRWLGKISFSVYLVQFAVLHFLIDSGVKDLFSADDNLGTAAFLACVTALTLPISYVTYHFIELRGIAFGKRVINSLDRSAAAKLSERKTVTPHTR